MEPFSDKVIAITGAASGIGLATARLLASQGAKLSICDINENALQDALKSLSRPERHMYKLVDVRISESVDEWIKATIDEYGRLDGAVNMAGIISRTMPISNETDEIWDRVLSVNCRGNFVCLRSQIRAMKDGGSIVSAASVWGQMGASGNAAYCASKAAVISLCRTAAKENPHIRINCVAPGSVETPLSATEDPEGRKRGLEFTVQKRTSAPSEVANVIVFLLSGEASFVTGAVYNVDGGWMC